MAKINQLSNGKSVGISIIAITGFPDYADFHNEDEKNSSHYVSLLQLISEMRSFCCDESICIELLLSASPEANQVYRSSVRIHLILRQIGSDSIFIEKTLESLSKMMIKFLKEHRYAAITVTQTDAKKILAGINANTATALIKKGQNMVSEKDGTILYYDDIIEGHDETNQLERIISGLSETNSAAISFALFPARIGLGERNTLEKMANMSAESYDLTKNCSCTLDGAYFALIEYAKMYLAAMERGFYYANITVFGERYEADQLIALLSNLLSGKFSGINALQKVDISSIAENLYSQFMVYPWNILMALRQVRRRYANPAQALQSLFQNIVSEQEIQCFFKLPYYSSLTLALNNEQVYYASERIDKSLLDESNIQLGLVDTFDGSLSLGLPVNRLTNHAVIVGMPGTGKTTFSINLLLQLRKKDIPFLVIEPTKNEYRSMVKCISDLKIFTPGKGSISPFVINPFLPPKGITLEQYKSTLMDCFRIAFPMEGVLEAIFTKTINDAYSEYGWSNDSKIGDRGVKIFGLYEFVQVFRRVMNADSVKYDRSIKGNIETGGVFRLMSLIEMNRMIFDSQYNIPIEDILGGYTVIELNAIQDESQKALIIALLLSNANLYIKHIRKNDGRLKNVMLIDEAHVLLGTKSNYDDIGARENAKKIIAEMILEVRALGMGIIIADQSPGNIGELIVGNAASKVVFRLENAGDKKLIGDSLDIDADIIKKIPSLVKGQALVHVEGLSHPQIVTTPDITKSYEGAVSDEYVSGKMASYREENAYLFKPYRECEYCSECTGGCDYHIRSTAIKVAQCLTNGRLSAKYISAIQSEKDLYRYVFGAEEIVTRILKMFGEKVTDRKMQCCVIVLRREFQNVTPFVITDKEFDKGMKAIFKKED